MLIDGLWIQNRKRRKADGFMLEIMDIKDECPSAQKVTQYAALMNKSRCDEVFLARTISCAKDFEAVDCKVNEEW